MKTEALLVDYLAMQDVSPAKSKEVRPIRYLKRMGMESRHSKRRADKLALLAIPSGKSTSKIVQAAKEGRIGVNKPWGLATTYFLTKNKLI